MHQAFSLSWNAYWRGGSRLNSDDYGFFLSPNSLKDDSGVMAPEGCSTLEIVTLAPFQPFAAWEKEKALKRSESYEAFKSEAADKLMASVERRWPGLVGDVAIKDVATPLTNQHFVGSPQGAIYGPSVIPSQWGHRGFRPTGPIGGLFLAGAGVFSPGVVPSLATGVVAGKAAAASMKSRSLLSLPSPLRKPLRRLMPSASASR